jgi:hypothetical protein
MAVMVFSGLVTLSSGWFSYQALTIIGEGT